MGSNPIPSATNAGLRAGVVASTHNPWMARRWVRMSRHLGGCRVLATVALCAVALSCGGETPTDDVSVQRNVEAEVAVSSEAERCDAWRNAVLATTPEHSLSSQLDLIIEWLQTYDGTADAAAGEIETLRKAQGRADQTGAIVFDDDSERVAFVAATLGGSPDDDDPPVAIQQTIDTCTVRVELPADPVAEATATVRDLSPWVVGIEGIDPALDDVAFAVELARLTEATQLSPLASPLLTSLEPIFATLGPAEERLVWGAQSPSLIAAMIELGIPARVYDTEPAD